jgi:Tol biopolymer transport system component
VLIRGKLFSLAIAALLVLALVPGVPAGYAQGRPTAAAPPGTWSSRVGANPFDSAINDLPDPVRPLSPAAASTTRVSVSSDGGQGEDGHSLRPSISADGRYVAFASGASNLASGDTNGYDDIFVHDRQTGQTTRVSVASDGSQENGSSWSPSISADGRYVAFASEASNLVSGDTDGYDDVFVHDRQMGQTTRVSVASDGTQGNHDSGHWGGSSISAGGRYVAFESWASNLVDSDTNSYDDVFVHDRQTGHTARVSVTSDGTQGNGESRGYPSISADGRYVAFESGASNLVSGDTNDYSDVFVHERVGPIYLPLVLCNP